MSERLKVAISKVAVGVIPPGVRIPASPYKKLFANLVSSFLLKKGMKIPLELKRKPSVCFVVLKSVKTIVN